LSGGGDDAQFIYSMAFAGLSLDGSGPKHIFGSNTDENNQYFKSNPCRWRQHHLFERGNSLSAPAKQTYFNPSRLEIYDI